MDAIASDTGGETFINRNDLTKAVGDAIQDGATNYYTLSRLRVKRRPCGEWRSIRIVANPGLALASVRLSYRRVRYLPTLTKVPAHHTGTASVSEDPNWQAELLFTDRDERTCAHATGHPLHYARLSGLHANGGHQPPGQRLDPKDPMKPPPASPP